MSGGLKARKIELLTADQSGGYTLFAPLADALGLAFGHSKRVALMVDRTPIDLGLEIDSGAVVAVTLLAGFEARPEDEPGRPELVVRRETFLDGKDKDAGVVREVQLGLAGFDAHVFIDSDASDDEVRRVLASEASRAPSSPPHSVRPW